MSLTLTPFVASHGQQHGQFGQFHRNNYHQQPQQQFNQFQPQHRFNFQGRNFQHSRQFPESSQFQPDHGFYKPHVTSFEPSHNNQPVFYPTSSFLSIPSCPQVSIFNETGGKIFGKVQLKSPSDSDGIEIEIEFNYLVLTFAVS